MAKAEWAIRDVERRIAFKVTITSVFKVRVWAAIQLLKLAARVINASIEIVTKAATPAEPTETRKE